MADQSSVSIAILKGRRIRYSFRKFRTIMIAFFLNNFFGNIQPANYIIKINERYDKWDWPMSKFAQSLLYINHILENSKCSWDRLFFQLLNFYVWLSLPSLKKPAINRYG